MITAICASCGKSQSLGDGLRRQVERGVIGCSCGAPGGLVMGARNTSGGVVPAGPQFTPPAAGRPRIQCAICRKDRFPGPSITAPDYAFREADASGVAVGEAVYPPGTVICWFHLIVKVEEQGVSR